MIAIEPAIVLSKLDSMMSYLDNLKRLDAVKLEEYLADYKEQLFVERLLQLIIQVAIDINKYLLKQFKIEETETSLDNFIEVGRHGIITMELAEHLVPSGSLHNRLIYGYEKINPVDVHEAIHKTLQNYPIYQRQVISYLDSLEADNA